MRRWLCCVPVFLATWFVTRTAVATAVGMPHGHGLPIVVANDNRTPAGSLKDGVLRLRLVASLAQWYPEADDGPSAQVVAFAEEGKAPQVPAPMIRVPEGTRVEATIRNALTDSTLWIHWLSTRPSDASDSVPILPGESRTVRFDAGLAGTYMYRAVVGARGVPRPNEREQLVGAFVIDPMGARAADRVFVMNIWGQAGDSALKRPHREILAINGKSWPYTEPLNAATGDTLPWRVINGTVRTHPMHLHGFYFRVDARGSMLRDTTFAPDQRRMAVTEDMNAFSTMAMTWVPERPGNWLFHCHISFHVMAESRLDAPAHDMHSADPRRHMAGLVLGIAVKADADYRDVVRGEARRISLFVNEGKPRGISPRALSFVEQRGDRAPAPDSVEIPGSMLVLTRGKPTDIAVTNRLREPTSVHWHGIELESFSDGVAGWSGGQKRLAPVIGPGETFTARLTLPRAGTFMYHTHLNDVEQLSSGMYGAIVVLEPGQRFDPATDHLYVAGWEADVANKRARTVINGDSTGPRRMLRAGVPHRFRFVNIGPANRLVFELRRGSDPAEWTASAKDGAALPSSQRVAARALRVLNVGETFDAELTPPSGEYLLVVKFPAANGPVVYRQRLIFE
ncbi:MAG: multicopper oxidase domain-containing protein [Longimicrobiales bacterium]